MVIIDYNEEREISALKIVNEKTGNPVFSFGLCETIPRPKKEEPKFTEISDGENISGVPCCEDCGTPFVSVQDPKTGKTLTPSECKELAIKLRGAAICKKCAAKRKLANG